MRNIIPIIIVAATVFVGCKSPTQANKTTAVGTTSAAAVTNTVASTNAAVATPVPAPVPVGPNTPAETLAENNTLGNLAAVFIGILTIAAVRRP